jgi:hypothetical protein
MEKTARLEYGPLEVEIHALEGEDYQEEILNIIQFIEENKESLEDLGGELDATEMSVSKSSETSLEEFAEDDEKQEQENEEPSGPLGAIASRLRTSKSKLEDFIYVDPDGDDFPVLYLDEVGNVGERKTDKQRVASLILLYIWHECYDTSRVKSSSLKDALELSNVSSTGMGNMYQGDGDRYFDRKGRGPSATVSLTPPGKRQARKALKNLLEEDSDELD